MSSIVGRRRPRRSQRRALREVRLFAGRSNSLLATAIAERLGMQLGAVELNLAPFLAAQMDRVTAARR